MMVLCIKGLQAKATLGVYDWEKKAKRPIIFSIRLTVDTKKATASDDIKDAVDYDRIVQAIFQELKNTSYQLIEKLADDVCRLLLNLDARIAEVTVETEKPEAIKQAISVSAIVTRKR